VATQAFNYCNPSVVSGGIVGGLGIASAIAPPATILGSCTSGSVDAMASASAGLGTGQLHAFATAAGQGYASASANEGDLLTLVPTSGFLDSTFPVTVTLAVMAAWTAMRRSVPSCSSPRWCRAWT